MFLKQLPDQTKVPRYLKIIDDENISDKIKFAQALKEKVNGNSLRASVQIGSQIADGGVKKITLGLNGTVELILSKKRTFYLKRCQLGDNNDLSCRGSNGYFKLQVV